jgi:hypothetical protein
MASATLRASASLRRGAGHGDLDEFGRAFAVAHDLVGEVEHHACSAA